MLEPTKQRKYQAFSLSILLHTTLFIIAAFCGLFSLKVYEKPTTPPVTVTVYDADALPAAAGASAGGGGADAMVVAQSAPESAQTAAIVKAAIEQSKAVAPTNTSKPQAATTDSSSAAAPAQQGNAAAQASGSASGSATGQQSGSGKGAGTAGNGSSSGKGNGGGGNGNDAAALAPRTPPRLLNSVAPRYPAALREAGVEGSVTLKIFVEASGGVGSVEVIASSGHDAMDAAAVAAAHRYRFAPALNSYGNAVPCLIRRRIVFQLEN